MLYILVSETEECWRREFLFFLAVPFMFSVNMLLWKMIAEPILDIWDILSAFILLTAAFSFIFGDYARNRKISK